MKKLPIATMMILTTSMLFASPDESVVKTGQESAGLLLKTLGGNMKAHMKSGGPMEALDFCSNEAYTLTESVNKKLQKGVSVKRISSKFRNPLNTPSEDEQKVLDELQMMQDKGEKIPPYVIKQIGEKNFKFYKPLTMDKPVCLKCHGDVQNEALKKEIAQRYPDDKAMGYKLGDLRGAVVVTIRK